MHNTQRVMSSALVWAESKCTLTHLLYCKRPRCNGFTSSGINYQNSHMGRECRKSGNPQGCLTSCSFHDSGRAVHAWIQTLQRSAWDTAKEIFNVLPYFPIFWRRLFFNDFFLKKNDLPLNILNLKWQTELWWPGLLLQVTLLKCKVHRELCLKPSNFQEWELTPAQESSLSHHKCEDIDLFPIKKITRGNWLALIALFHPISKPGPVSRTQLQRGKRSFPAERAGSTLFMT